MEYVLYDVYKTQKNAKRNKNLPESYHPEMTTHFFGAFVLLTLLLWVLL